MLDVMVDLRAHLGRPRDQGRRATCLAHATSAAHEHRRGYASFLSVEYLHHFAVSSSSGSVSFDEIREALRDHGQPLEGDCPYQSNGPAFGWSPPSHLTVFRRASDDMNAAAGELERALRSGCVPIIGVTVPPNFYTPAAPWIITDGGGAPIGRHALAVVGLATANGGACYLIRNSWGEDWGDDGHAWLDVQFLQVHLKEVIVLTAEVN